MKLVGLGANLPSRFGAPAATLEAALDLLGGSGIRVLGRSPWYESAPVPISDQDWYVNGVAEVATELPPDGLLRQLHAIERAFGRTRTVPNAARPIDLDLLDYDGMIESGWPVLPHPRMHERGFVLLPLLDVAPDWRHPVSGLDAARLLDAAPRGTQAVRVMRSRG
jgi:2-amino-4-hydroxy-6-hydroxymethyldihydropteridine diphosphokinase